MTMYSFSEGHTFDVVKHFNVGVLARSSSLFEYLSIIFSL